MEEEIKNPINKTVNKGAISEVSISLADPEQIKKWSYGEVKKPETINYRTLKPERDGLFCAKIFGPIKDYECLCVKYKGRKHRNIVCENCGVEITLQKVRRERMGHIELASPVAHIWFVKSNPSKIGSIVGITNKELEKVLYFESYIVIEQGATSLARYQVLNENAYKEALENFGEDSFVVGMGADAIYEILSSIDVPSEIKMLKEDLESVSSEIKQKKILKKLKLLEDFRNSGNKLENMIIRVLPVLPPELRPLVPLEGGRFATSDLNDLYRRVINRNNRLKLLFDLNAPEIIVKNEKRMLQEAVDALFDNSKKERPIADGNRRPLKSFSDMLRGKQGRFRQSLLGKRVDYSGRSVITVGPDLKLHQCGLPKKMALELFKPFIYSKLEKYGYASTIKNAKKVLEQERPEVWDILEEVVREHPVLLNRAPTLHRLGIQAFEPKITDGNAIHLHPLVCTAFNADFDGDQMAVHVPLSVEARVEARLLMMSTNNILSPANGKPIIVPTQDIILGLYYLTLEEQKEKRKVFADIEEAEKASHFGVISMHSPITIKMNVLNKDGNEEALKIDTTLGRAKMIALLPKNKDLGVELLNKLITKKEITQIIDSIYRFCGQDATVKFCEDTMDLGFKTACDSGISIGKSDLVIPENKTEIVAETEKLINEYERQYKEGLITVNEKYNKVISAWSECADKVTDSMMSYIEKSDTVAGMNSIYMMMDSGARGAVSQLKQLAGMRGLMAKPSGEIIETPIKSNFKEGLTVMEYFSSTHGARKGLADTALKTANAGYLTRRLVDVSQDIIISSEDCKTENGIHVYTVFEGATEITSLTDRILGRCILEDIVDFDTKEVLVKKGTIITEDMLGVVAKSGIERIKVKSPVTCEAERGVCIKCYGFDISFRKMVSLGAAVGVMAAQSIGEPGTQLTMRTFHVGGAAQSTSEKNSIISPVQGTVEFRKYRYVVDGNGDMVVMSRNSEVIIRDKFGAERFRDLLQYGSKIYVKDGEVIDFDTKIAEWDPFTRPIVVEKEGIVHFSDLIEGVSCMHQIDELTGLSGTVVTHYEDTSSKNRLKPSIALHAEDGGKKSDVVYALPPGASINVIDGQKVVAGDVIARIPKDLAKTTDITGGLPRVVELFEARAPKDSCFISDIEGIVEYGKTSKTKRHVIIRSEEDPEEFYEYSIPRFLNLLVYEGDKVEKGDVLSEGVLSPHDILRVSGVDRLADYMINEVQNVYRMQGVVINDKHIEVVVRQMVKKVSVIEPKSSEYLAGDLVNLKDIIEYNEDKGEKEKIKYARILQSITRASLRTDSFISAASFQETTKILTQAVIEGKSDKLRGLKESIVVGKLIPAGTGFIK